MQISTYPEIQITTVNNVPAAVADACQEDRIKIVFGLSMDRATPKVNRRTLIRYYEYLSTHLLFPFVAQYPELTNLSEERDFRCLATSLVSPATLGDEFDGLFCTVRKEKCKLNLPLIELIVPQTTRNFQLIEDYWYWLWNWR